jgi:hypothetical protein
MDQVSIGHGKHEDEFLIYHFLNDEIKINKFKNDKKRVKSTCVIL